MLANPIVPPVYSQIALDIALRIARGDLQENTKVYGRSVMASEYGVSPETVRRSMKLLEDMEVVEVRQNSGAVVLSADKARAYVKKFGEQNDIRARQKSLGELLERQQEISREISEVAGSIVRINEKFMRTNPFHNYEAKIPNNSPLIGQTLGELKFWQQTAATVIAIRRGERIILSPGPYAALLAGDILVFVGDLKSVSAVSEFIG